MKRFSLSKRMTPSLPDRKLGRPRRGPLGPRSGSKFTRPGWICVGFQLAWPGQQNLSVENFGLNFVTFVTVNDNEKALHEEILLDLARLAGP